MSISSSQQALELAREHQAAGRFAEAQAIYRHLFPSDPQNAGMGLFQVAGALFLVGRYDESAAAWRELIAVQPNAAILHSNLAATLEKAGHLEDAVATAQRAIALNPADPYAHNNLGGALSKLGRFAEARDAHRQAVTLDPSFGIAWGNLAYCLQELEEFDESEAAGRRAIARTPDDPLVHRTLALTLQTVAKIDESLAHYGKTIELLTALRDAKRAAGQDALAQVYMLARSRRDAAITLPTVYESVEDLEQRRARLIENVKKLREDDVRIDLADDAVMPPFMLTYQGKNDIDIHRAVAELMDVPPSPLPPRRSDGKIRLGFVSRYLRNHTIGLLNRGLIAQLNRDDFEVTVFSFGDIGESPIGLEIQKSADRFVTLPSAMQPARDLVLEQQPDILFYPDIGMEPWSYSFAFSRLAPVQCVAWGHPVTTGIKTIDYFISSDLLETEDSQSQYSEQLVRLPAPAIYYERPTLIEPMSRVDFGLPDDANIYGCIQAVWKFHPEFDAILAQVLARDPKARILILHGVTRYWEERLMQRFARTLGEGINRIIPIQHRGRNAYLALCTLCNVMLDPIHFGGGNTSYESFALGVPIVTWPSQLLRGRITQALYKMMNIDDCIAKSQDEYVDLAIALGVDSSRREAMSEKILAANSVLYENPAGVRALEDFFRDAVKRAPV